MNQFEDNIEFAKELDQADPLASFKKRFYIQEGVIYMDGNYCCLDSVDEEKYLLKALEDWKKYGIELWSKPNEGYFLYQDKLGELTAPLINAKSEEITICTNTTINIHQAVATFYNPTEKRNKIIMDDLNFPTDRYAVYSQIKLHGYNPEESLKIVKSRDGKTLNEDDFIEAMTDDVCMILLPSVLYRSSYLLNMEKISKVAKERGVIVGFDLCHSIGSVPHDFSK